MAEFNQGLYELNLSAIGKFGLVNSSFARRTMSHHGDAKGKEDVEIDVKAAALAHMEAATANYSCQPRLGKALGAPAYRSR